MLSDIPWSDLSWAWPWLGLIWPLPWLLGKLRNPASVVQRPVPALRLPGLPASLGAAHHRDHNQRPWLLWLSWSMLLLAVMRPVLPADPVRLPAQGRDLMLAVDLSGSMNEQDVIWDGAVRTRLQAVQAAAGEFLRSRSGDRIGLVLFGETAHLYTPLSLDTETAADMLREAEVGLAGEKTAIGDALAVATEHLLDASQADERVIVLLTDGENNAGRLTPEQAAQLAADAGIRIHTIGLSGDQPRGRGLFGRLLGSGLDREQLETLANIGGGISLIAQGGASLAEVYEQLNRIEPQAVAEEFRLPPREFFWWPLLGALLLVVLQLVREVHSA